MNGDKHGGDTAGTHRETEWYEYGLRATAVRRFGRRQVRCRIDLDTWTDNDPRVSFWYRYPNHERWSSVATGSLGSPTHLRDWMELFEVFGEALDALVEEIDGPVSGGQIKVFENRTDETHPVFEVVHRPRRVPVGGSDDE